MSLSPSNGNLEAEKWAAVLNKFEMDCTEAYYTIDKAFKLDEEGKIDEALPVYKFGLDLIDKALTFSLNPPSNPDLSWEKALAMTQKLKKTRNEILIRIENVKSKPDVKTMELLPPCEEAASNFKSSVFGAVNTNGNSLQLPGPSKADTLYIPLSAAQDKELLANLHLNEQGQSKAPVTYSDLSQQLEEMKLGKIMEILCYCDNTQLYFISPDGRVSSTLEPNALIIARVHVEAMDLPSRTILQVGSWIYPLIPEVSPCIRNECGAFIFPDVLAEVEGASVGIILPEEKQDEVHELLMHLLNDVSAKGRSRRSVDTDYSPDTFSSKIVRGAAYLSHYMVRGAGSTAQFLDYSTPKIIDRINPSPQPKPINPTIQKAAEVAKTVSGKAVDATDYLATKIYMATSALGRYLSPYIQREGTHLFASTMNMSEEKAVQKINSALNITSDAIECISTIYSGLNAAAGILGRSLANNTIQIIEYKYGQPAGALTNDAITTLGNVYYTHHNFRALKPKGIAKAAVRGAGQALLEDYRNVSKNSEPHEEFQGSGPGNGSGFSTV